MTLEPWVFLLSVGFGTAGGLIAFVPGAYKRIKAKKQEIAVLESHIQELEHKLAESSAKSQQNLVE